MIKYAVSSYTMPLSGQVSVERVILHCLIHPVNENHSQIIYYHKHVLNNQNIHQAHPLEQKQ